jgi:hypothetical protein
MRATVRSSNAWTDANALIYRRNATAYITAEISATKTRHAHRTTPLASNTNSVVRTDLNASSGLGYAMVHLTVPTSPMSLQHANSSPARVAISGAKTSDVYLANSTVTITMIAEITRTKKTAENTAVLPACGHVLTPVSASLRTNSAMENPTVLMAPMKRLALTTCAQVLDAKQDATLHLREANVPVHKSIGSTNASNEPALTSTNVRNLVIVIKTVRTIDLGSPALAWALATDLK